MSEYSDRLAAESQAENPDLGPGRPFFDPVDAVAAVPRGIVDAAKNVYGLLDTVTFDALPDWKDNPLGESTSTVGGFIEGATDFMAGFLPVAGVLGKVGKLSKLGAFASESPMVAALARSTIASGVAGFTVMDGHEQRLSNLLQDTSLANPISEYLATDSTDGELEGRLKSALENSILGLAGDALVEGVGKGLKALKVARRVRAEKLAAGATPEEASLAAHAAGVEAGHGVPPFVEPALDNPAVNPALDVSTPEGVLKAGGVDNQVDNALPTPDEAVRAAGQAPESLKKEVRALEGPPQVEDVIEGRKRQLVRSMGFDQKKTEEFLKRFEDRVNSAVEFDETAVGATGVNPKALTKEERFARALTSESMNLSHWVGTTDSDQIIRTIEDLYGAIVRTDVSAMAPRTHAETQAAVNANITEIAHVVGADPNSPLLHYTLAQRSGQHIKNLDEALAHTGVVKMVLQMKAQHLADLAREIVATTDDTLRESLGVRIKTAQRETTSLYGQLRGLYKSAGRIGDSARIRAYMPPELWKPNELTAQLDELGGVEEIVKWARKANEAAKTNAMAVHDLLHVPLGTRILNATQEFWMNALLSGLKTTMVNVLGPSLHSVYRPAERMLGASLLEHGATAMGNRQLALAANEVVHTTFAQLTHLYDSVAESFAVAKRMGLSGDNILDARAGVKDRAGRAIASANFNINTASIGGKLVDWMGTVVNVPTAILSSGDELTKNINYRAYAKGIFHREGQKAGLFGQELEAFKAKRMTDLIYKDQLFTSQTLFQRGWDEAMNVMPNASREERTRFAVDYARKAWQPIEKGGIGGERLSALSQEALSYARDVTFTTPAAPGSVSMALQRFVYQHPLARFVLPFINTPMNLVKWTGQRLDAPSVIRYALARALPEDAPLGLNSLKNTKSRLLQDALSNDPKRMADAIGRVSTGAGISAFIMAKAAQGEITGRGPKDPEQRRQLLDAGWLPYAFKVGDKYISYARLDPLASLLGTVADISDYSKYAHVDDQEKVETMAWGVAYAAANNFTNKTYLAGLANFVDAIQNPERNLPNFMRSMGASLLPNIAGQAVPAFGDENMRDVRSMLDAWVNKTPGLSDTLPPQRNVLGEPIKRIPSAGHDAIGAWVDWFNPIAATHVGDDLIKNEMVGLKHAFTTPKPSVNGLNLSGVTMPSGQTVYDRWQELHGEVKIGGMTIRDSLRKLIKSKDYQRLSDETTSDFESPRVAEINSVIREYRQRAWQQVLKESPEVKKYMQDYTTTKRLLKAGKDTRIIPGGAR